MSHDNSSLIRAQFLFQQTELSKKVLIRSQDHQCDQFDVLPFVLQMDHTTTFL